MKRKYIYRGQLKTGEKVFDLEHSNLQEDLQNEHGENLVRECLSQTNSSEMRLKRDIIKQYDFPDFVGNNMIVKTTSQDEIVYAQRMDNKKCSRFVKNRKLQKTKSIT